MPAAVIQIRCERCAVFTPIAVESQNEAELRVNTTSLSGPQHLPPLCCNGCTDHYFTYHPQICLSGPLIVMKDKAEATVYTLCTCCQQAILCSFNTLNEQNTTHTFLCEAFVAAYHHLFLQLPDLEFPYVEEDDVDR